MAKYNEQERNSITVDSGANLQSAYDDLLSSKYNAKMGTISAGNKRWLMVEPGAYNQSITLSNANVGIKEVVPSTVFLSGDIINAIGAPTQLGNIDGVGRTLTITPSLDVYGTVQASYDALISGLFGTPTTDNKVWLILGIGTYPTEEVTLTNLYVGVAEAIAGTTENVTYIENFS